MFPANDWAAELPRMLRRQDPESFHLDYKARGSLLPLGRGGPGVDRQKRAEDISKDVSSFLNSDGGVLIYGIREENDPQSTATAPVPASKFDPSIDGYDRHDIDEETIENLITTNVQPRPAPELFHVAGVEIEGRTVFVVEVSKGLEMAYQAKDLKYYRRFHYKAEPMEHYEIEMVRSRAAGPQLEIVAGLTSKWDREIRVPAAPEKVAIHLGVRNTGRMVTDIALLEIGIFESNSPESLPSRILYAEERNIHYVHPSGDSAAGIEIDEPIRWYQIYWTPTGFDMDTIYKPLFNTLDPIYVSSFDFIVGQGARSGRIGTWCWRVQAPQMPPKQGLMSLVYQMPGRLSLVSLDWPFQVEALE